MPFYNETIDKKKITDIIGKSCKDCGNYKTVSFLDELKDMGFEFAFKSGLSIAISDIHIPQKKEDIFARLKKLQDHLASNVDILPLRPEEEYWEEEKTEVFGELEPELVQEPAMVYPEKEEVAWDGSTPILPKSPIKMDQRNWLSTIMGDGNHIKKALILNEILGKPRGLRPY